MSKKILILSIMIFSIYAYADQDINIIGGNNANLPKIDVIQFTKDDNSENSPTNVVLHDLDYTGEFNLQKYNSLDDATNTPDYIVTGSVVSNSKIHIRVLNAKSKAIMLNEDILTNNQSPRYLGHLASNAIYKKITNTKGIFTSKISYILKKHGTYNIVVSDYDGYNSITVVAATSPLISLDWDKSDKLIAYSSLESGKPVVYIQNLYQGTRTLIANFNGSNSSPAFVPNSKQIAVTLSKDYGSHIFLVNNAPFSENSHATTLIKFGTIDTEAAISGNGNMVFTSNHDGGPQIFLTNINNTDSPKRLTMDLGNYNTTARFSHDGSKIVFINRNYGTLKTYFMDLANKNSYPLSLKTNLDISPSFAPNDKLVLLSSDNRMYIANSTGTSEKLISQINADGGGKIIDQRWANN